MGDFRPSGGSDSGFRARLRRPARLVLVTAAFALAGFATATVAWPQADLGTGTGSTATETTTAGTETTTTTSSSSESTTTTSPSGNAGADPDLAVSQTATPNGVAVNGDLTYTVTATNNGPDPATNVVVTDTLPEGAVFVSAAGCSLDGKVYCGAFGLANGESKSFDIRVKAPSAPGRVSNHAEVAGAEPDGATGNNSSDLVVTVGDVDLSVTKNASTAGPVEVGSTFSYTLTVVNAGPGTATGTVVDQLPSELEFVFAAEGTCSHDGNLVQCGFSLERTSSQDFHLTVRAVNVGAAVTNTAKVSTTSNLDYNPGNDQAPATPGLRIYDVDLSISKSASPSPVTAFHDVTYTITVRNDAQQAAPVVVTDPLPSFVTFKSADAGCTPDPDARSVTCGGAAGANVPGDGGTRTFNVVVTAGAAGERTNTASVSAVGPHLDRVPGTLQARLDVGVNDPVAGNERVLILETTVSDGTNSIEAQAARGLGYNVDVVTDAQWRGMTAAQFAAYRAIVLGDATCGSTYAAALANTKWGAVVNGNVIVNGTDPVFHEPEQRLETRVTDASVAFATAVAGKTGAYVSLSCSGSAAVLAPLGGFTLGGARGDDAHIVADHPVLRTLTDAYIANWSSSVHESFSTWPSDYLVLALIRNDSSTFTAPDGTKGYPYMLARGGGLSVISDIKLAPEDASKNVGESHTLTATVVQDGAPLAGKTVTFTVVDGPNKGQTSNGVTGADGKATFTYSSSTTGTDKITARFVDASERTQTSNQVTATWTGAPSPPPPPPTPPKADVGVSVSGPTSARVGQSVTFKVSVVNSGPDAATGVVLKTPVPAGATLDSVSSTTGDGCTTGGGTTTCILGTLAAGTTATVTMILTVTKEGQLILAPSAQGDYDPNAANNSSSTTVTVLSPTALPPAPPPPSQPGIFNAIGLGTVTVNGIVVPADQVFQLNSGDAVDVTGGTLTFTTSDGSFLSVSGTQFTARKTSSRGGSTATSDVPAQFKVAQPATTGEVTTLTLTGGDFASCAKTRSLSATDKHPVRQLWGSGKGTFRTTGRYSAATVRGTVWLTQDRCDGTLTSVVEGVVDVLDTSLNKTVAVSPGQSYLALPKQKAPFKPASTSAQSQIVAVIRKQGLHWGGKTFKSRAEFEQWLVARGRTWLDFKAHYPVPAAALAARK